MVSARELLNELIVSAEKAALIARACREETELFSLLVEEKTGSSKNPRFVQDFKTLADVLVQEAIRHDLMNKFPGIEKHIRGEESNQFTNVLGESIKVEVKSTQEETAALLLEVLDNNQPAATILSKIVHSSLDYTEDEKVKSIPSDLVLDIDQIGIWIDPIDSTQEYVRGSVVLDPQQSFPTSGLYCVTCLIGVYSLLNGESIMGVVHQPFASYEEKKFTGKHFWGIAIADNLYHNIDRKKTKGQENKILVSGSEAEEVLIKLRRRYETVEVVGAGYKLLSVATGKGHLFATSKSSTYKWDTCAPHAILKSLGGNLLTFDARLDTSSSNSHDKKKGFEIVYNEPNIDEHGAQKWANKNGLIAYADKSALLSIQSCFC